MITELHDLSDVYEAIPSHVSVGQFDTFDGDLIALTGKLGNPPLIIGNPNVQEPLF